MKKDVNFERDIKLFAPEWPRLVWLTSMGKAVKAYQANT